MHINVKLFATLRQRAGWSKQQIELPDGATLGTLMARLSEENPSLDLYNRIVYAAINAEYGQPDQLLVDGDDVAFFPPVSGGAFRTLDAELRESSTLSRFTSRPNFFNYYDQ